jgi:hypothetical protein
MMLHLQLACILLLCIQGVWSHEGPEISVGDMVIVGDVSAGETACVTARNREGEGEGEGTYQVDYQDGETSDETVAGEELTLAISHTKADCRNPGGRGGGGRGGGGHSSFRVGDEVIIGEIAADERGCVTALNADGSYQIDYQDGFTNDERVPSPPLANLSARICSTRFIGAIGGFWWKVHRNHRNGVPWHPLS